jgi:hypothetical protein
MIRFLFQSLVGTLLLAFVGVLMILFAGCGFFTEVSREQESAPTPLALAEFEATGKVPTQRWIEFTDGVLLWDHGTEIVTTRKDKAGKQVGDEKVNVVFVPLVSKKIVDAAKGFRTTSSNRCTIAAFLSASIRRAQRIKSSKNRATPT